MKHDEFVGLFKQCNAEFEAVYSYIDQRKWFSLCRSIGQIAGLMRQMAIALEPETQGFKKPKALFKDEGEE